MKKIFSIFSAALCLTMVGCDEDPIGPDTPNGGGNENTPSAAEFKVEADTEEVVLDSSSESLTAITFTWSTGSNFGTGSAINYVWEIAEVDDDYTDGYKEDLGRNVTERSFGVGELNNYLRTNLLAIDGEPTTYKVRVSAVVAGSDVEQSDEVTFTATTYEPFTGELYMIGGAVTTGWSLDLAPAFELQGSGVFTWTGRMNSGDFKFVTNRTDFWPGYVRDGSDPTGMTLKYFAAQPSDGEDLKFNLAAGGTYTITVDVLNLTLKIEEAEGEYAKFDKLYFVSEGNSWSFLPMYQDVIDPFIFRYNGVINAGGFKFGTAEGSWENMYKAPTAEDCVLDFNNSDKTWETGAELVTGFEPDFKWNVSAEQAGKAYKVALNITESEETMTIWQFDGFEALWLVGDATQLGWSLDDIEKSEAQKMTLKDPSNPYVFTWTGALNNGELKFSCDLQKDWGGNWFHSTRADEPFGGQNNSACPLYKGGSDYKWKVTAGTYTITIDTLNETITVQ